MLLQIQNFGSETDVVLSVQPHSVPTDTLSMLKTPYSQYTQSTVLIPTSLYKHNSAKILLLTCPEPLPNLDSTLTLPSWFFPRVQVVDPPTTTVSTSRVFDPLLVETLPDYFPAL